MRYGHYMHFGLVLFLLLHLLLQIHERRVLLQLFPHYRIEFRDL